MCCGLCVCVCMCVYNVYVCVCMCVYNVYVCGVHDVCVCVCVVYMCMHITMCQCMWLISHCRCRCVLLHKINKQTLAKVTYSGFQLHSNIIKAVSSRLWWLDTDLILCKFPGDCVL